jgi:hypothetical protein
VESNYDQSDRSLWTDQIFFRAGVFYQLILTEHLLYVFLGIGIIPQVPGKLHVLAIRPAALRALMPVPIEAGCSDRGRKWGQGGFIEPG